ncbi:MAG: SDR family NAD(P)-dependent oxidoreductase [Gemmatimonadaceae bacterium]|nr:SDR family NAD(P)-dependent oxidoreductase [Gloeobacterales cyanobacterium ES-bin-141]
MVVQSKDTVFITGGSSGIGEGLARAFHTRGATVIIGGRNEGSLMRVTDECPGMETLLVNISEPESIARCASVLGERHPDLNVVINNAGVQHLVDFRGPEIPSLELIDAEIDTNLRGLIHMTAAFLPILRRQSAARIIQVSSGLAFIPLVRSPIYSATKAAVHAFSIALREQLRGSSVQVVELIPPIVKTNLHRNQPAQPDRAMSVDQFVARAIRALDSGQDEIAVGLASVLSIGARVAPGQFLKIVNAPR